MPTGATHDRHTCPLHLEYFASLGSGTRDPATFQAPGISALTWHLPFHLSRRPRPRYLFIPTRAPSSPSEPGHLRSHPVRCSDLAPTRRKPQSPALPHRPPHRLNPRSHSPRIPSLRKGSVSFPGTRATNLGATAGGVASCRANPPLPNECRRSVPHSSGLWPMGGVT